jgi:murein DD-endopeptidase MepM/ murein hydrolase activator NlpD
MRFMPRFACLTTLLALLAISGASAYGSRYAAVRHAPPSGYSSLPAELFQLSFPISTKAFKWYTGTNPDRYADYSSILDHRHPFYVTYNDLEPYTGEHGPTTGSGGNACGQLEPSERGYCYNGHSGLDIIPTTTGTAVYASHAGIVVRVTDCDATCAYGKTIRIRDLENPSFLTLYAHLSTLTVGVGERVARGQQIGESGCTGYGCGGPHLHWGLYYDTSGNTEPPDLQGYVLDPYGWLSRRPNPIANPSPVPTDYKWAKGYSSYGFQNELPTFDLNEGTLQGHEYINKSLVSSGVYRTGLVPTGSSVHPIERWWANSLGAAGPPLSNVYNKPGSGECQDFEGGTYCTNVNGNPLYQPYAFTDVALSHWAHRYIEWSSRENIISGYGDGTFRPYNFVTREQISKMVVNAFNFTIVTPPQPTFCDVPDTVWSYPFIETLYSMGIISGYAYNSSQCVQACVNGNTRPCFIPNGNVTRGQMSKMVAESARNKWAISIYSALRGPDYWDVPASALDPYYNYIRTLNDIGAIRYRRADGDPGCTYGTDCQDLGHFFVGWSATRAQVAQLLHETIYSFYCPPPNSCPRQ